MGPIGVQKTALDGIVSTLLEILHQAEGVGDTQRVPGRVSTLLEILHAGNPTMYSLLSSNVFQPFLRFYVGQHAKYATVAGMGSMVSTLLEILPEESPIIAIGYVILGSIVLAFQPFLRFYLALMSAWADSYDLFQPFLRFYSANARRRLITASVCFNPS